MSYIVHVDSDLSEAERGILKFHGKVIASNGIATPLKVRIDLKKLIESTVLKAFYAAGGKASSAHGAVQCTLAENPVLVEVAAVHEEQS